MLIELGYLSYCSLSVSSIQRIDKPRLSTELLLTGCFLLHHSELTLENVVGENPRRSAVIDIKIIPSDTDNQFNNEITFFPILHSDN